MKPSLAIIIFFAFITSCNNNSGNDKPPTGNGPSGPAIMSTSIINSYPHDTSFYTQGLTIYKGEMYEGTGLEGKSRLMKIELSSGKILKQINLPAADFGEGIAILNDTIYQLTWRNRKAYAYTLNDLKKVKEYEITHDGWGLTTDGQYLIATDGSSTVYYYEPSTFKLVRKFEVTEGGSFAFNLNELEYIDGHIYANQYELPYILKIDPEYGNVVAKADLGAVWKKVQQLDPHAEVPNGIAYDSTSKKIYVTGKLWPSLYEIQFSK